MRLSRLSNFLLSPSFAKSASTTAGQDSIKHASPVTSPIPIVTPSLSTNPGYPLALLSDPSPHPKIMVASVVLAVIFIFLFRQKQVPLPVKGIEEAPLEKPIASVDDGEKPSTTVEEPEKPVVVASEEESVKAPVEILIEAPVEVPAEEPALERVECPIECPVEEPEVVVEPVVPEEPIPVEVEAPPPPEPTVIIAQHPGLDEFIEDFKSFSRSLLEAEPSIRTQLQSLEDRLLVVQEQVINVNQESQKDAHLLLTQFRLVEDRLAEFESRLQGHTSTLDGAVVELRANTQALTEQQAQLQSLQVAVSANSHRERRYPASVGSELSPGYQTDENHPHFSSSDVDVIPIHAPAPLERPPSKRKNPKRDRSASLASPKTVTFAASASASAVDSDDTAVEMAHSSDVPTPVEPTITIPEVTVSEPLYSARTDDSEVFVYKPISELEPSPINFDYNQGEHEVPELVQDLGDQHEEAQYDEPVPQVLEDNRNTTPVATVPSVALHKLDMPLVMAPVELDSPVGQNFGWAQKGEEADYDADRSFSQSPKPHVVSVPLSMPVAKPAHDPMTADNLAAHESAYAAIPRSTIPKPQIIELMEGSDSGMESSDVTQGAAGFPPGLTKNQKKAIKRKRREKAKKLNAQLEVVQTAGDYASSQE